MFSKIFPKIHAEGYKFLVISGIITIVFYSFSNFLGLIGLVLTIWVYYFFRDPDRVIIEDDNYLVSPADGEILKVEEVDGPKELGLENKRLCVLKESNDGFFIAEKDLELRGPGDVFGTRQSGENELKLLPFIDKEKLLLVKDLAIDVVSTNNVNFEHEVLVSLFNKDEYIKLMS